MFATTRIGAVCVYVSDIARTRAFYGEVLGLPIQSMGDDDSGNDWLQAETAGGVEMLFFKQPAAPGGSPVIIFDLKTGDIAAVIDALEARGTEILSPVSEAPGGWSAEFADPDGHILSVFQAAGLRPA
ncbi:VOC family protein [Brevundimonas staleyi]|uniref:VOC family protein n=1 Tax=Brevundimonas staleyi TaxID=74326 RepID=A0ABW0FW35_9CAUL